MEVGCRVGCVLPTLNFPHFLLLCPRCHHSMRSALERESVGYLTADCWAALSTEHCDLTADCCSDCATALELILQSWSSNSHSGSGVHVKITKWSKCHCFLDNPVLLKPSVPSDFPDNLFDHHRHSKRDDWLSEWWWQLRNPPPPPPL